jgi:hypothetical protein
VSRPLQNPTPRPSDTLRAILQARGSSLAELSRQSRTRFAGNPLFRIPPNFYDALERVSFSPSLHQLFALSTLTGYRLADWLHLFGLSFDDASRFQASWPRYRTAELDARVYDPDADVSWFNETQSVRFGAGLTPLSQWLSGKTVRPLGSLATREKPSFRYFKIGSHDTYAFPDLLPGSIVRIDGRHLSEDSLFAERTERILAIEHSEGVVCGRLRPAGHDRVVLFSRQLPYAPVELQLGTEARILGVVDLEIRPLTSLEAPEVSASAARVWTPGPLADEAASGRGKDWMRRARIRSGLSFREASERTREIAKILDHPSYFCAASALSDVEAHDLFPRHVHKLISLSATYCVSIADVVSRTGLQLEDAGREPMLEEWKYALRRPSRDGVHQPSRFLNAVQDELEEIPFFLRNALTAISRLPNVSVRDLFWAGATGELTHPYVKDSVLLAVNRQSKTPATSLSSPVWAQPLYVLEMRNGDRLCAACSLQNGTLVVRPCSTAAKNLLKLRNRVDVEILGKVVAIVRRVNARK